MDNGCPHASLLDDKFNRFFSSIGRDTVSHLQPMMITMTRTVKMMNPYFGGVQIACAVSK